MNIVSVAEVGSNGMIRQLVSFHKADVDKAESLFSKMICEYRDDEEPLTVREMNNVLSNGFYPGYDGYSIQIVWSSSPTP